MLVQYLILIAYLGILFLLGYIASKRIKNISDYYVGGKQLNYWLVAFSSRATGESAWLLLGLTGMGAISGVSAYWVVVGEILGVGVAWFFMASKFKRLTDEYDSITIPDFLESHFKSKNFNLRKISAIAMAIFVVIYVSAQIDATGTAFESFLGWNYFAGAIVGFLIVLAYIFLGGFVAVAWSDMFQGILMFAGLVLLPIVGIYTIGSWDSIIEGLRTIDAGLLDPWGPGGFTSMNLMTLLGFALIGLGFLGSPQVFVRFISVRDQKEIKKGRWVAIFYTLLTDAAAVTIGLIGRYIFTSTGTDAEAVLGSGGQDVLPMAVHELMPGFLIGMYVAIVLSAIMSTIDSLLVVGSSALTRDLYQKVFHPKKSLEELTGQSRITTLVMAFLALALSMIVAVSTPDRTIFWFVIFGWSGIAATFCPVIILALMWKGYTEKGAIVSMVSGFIAVPIFKFVVPHWGSFGAHIEKLDVMGPSFVVAIVLGVLTSLAFPESSKPENQ
ncbi:sodium/proline symporter [bacterium]|nr:sodium/proline symporter [bacterium]